MLFSLNYTYMHARDHFARLIGKITRVGQSKSVMCRWSTGIEQSFWKINLFSPRYCWTNAELAVHNNHSLTLLVDNYSRIIRKMVGASSLTCFNRYIYIWKYKSMPKKVVKTQRPFYLFKIHLWCKSIVKTVHYF